MAFSLNEVTKIIRAVYTPGSPYVPADPGQPYRAAYCETIEQSPGFGSGQSGEGGGAHGCLVIPINHPVYDDQGNFLRYDTSYEWQCWGGQEVQSGGSGSGFNITGSTETTSKTVCYPEQPYIPPTPAQPGADSQTSLDYNIGWNSGAHGDERLSAGEAFQFSIYAGSVGAAVGVTDHFQLPNTSYAGMELCVMATKGTFAVMVAGQTVTPYRAFSSSEVFRISLAGGRLFVTRNGSYVYDKEADADRYNPDVALYSGGDGVYDGSIETVYASQRLAESQTVFSADVAAHVPDDGVAESTGVFSGVVGAVEVDGAVFTRAESATVFSTSVDTAREVAIGSTSVFASSVMAHVGVSVELAIEPLEGIAYGPWLYNGYVEAAFEPLQGESDGGFLKPSTGLVTMAFAPITGAARGLTGSVGTVDGSFEPLAGLASEGDYCSVEAEFRPLEGIAYEIPDFDGFLTADLPVLTFDGYMSESPSYGVVRKLPQLTFEGQFGSQLDSPLPALAFEGSIENDGMMRVDAQLPGLTFSGSLYAGAILTTVRPLPALTFAGQFGSQLKASLPAITSTITVTGGNVLRLDRALPALTLEAAASHDEMISMSATLPVLEPLYGVLKAELPALTFQGAMVATPEAFAVEHYGAYAMNLTNDAMTTYTNFGFDFIVRFEGDYYGFNPNGAHLLEGDTDAGADIEARFVLPPADFETSRLKRVNNVYIGSDSDGPLLVKATADEGRHVTVQTGHSGRNRRAKIPKGLKGRFWGFEIQNQHGRRLKVDAIEILPDVLRRKV